jgi:hypothetical protein
VPPKTPSKQVQKNHHLDYIIRNKDAKVETRRRIRSLEQTHLALSSTIEPNSFEESNKDEFWNKDMDEELDQIEKNDTWEFVPRPKNKNVIGTKWVFRNKLNEDEHVKECKHCIKGFPLYVIHVTNSVEDNRLRIEYHLVLHEYKDIFPRGNTRNTSQEGY